MLVRRRLDLFHQLASAALVVVDSVADVAAVQTGLVAGRRSPAGTVASAVEAWRARLDTPQKPRV